MLVYVAVVLDYDDDLCRVKNVILSTGTHTLAKKLHEYLEDWDNGPEQLFGMPFRDAILPLCGGYGETPVTLHIPGSMLRVEVHVRQA